MDEQSENLPELPIDGTLDLHTFPPREIKDLVPEYIAECLRRGILQLRIIHGKGTGTQRRIVQVMGRHGCRSASAAGSRWAEFFTPQMTYCADAARKVLCGRW
jgi:hypothetical protein